MLVAEEAVEIRVLRRQGKSIREIARMLEVSRNTVRRYLRVEGSPRYEREARPSKLDPYKHYIDERVKAAAPDWIPATVLLRCGEMMPPPPVARQLNLMAKAQAILLERVNFAGGMPLSISTLYFPAARFAGFDLVYAKTQSITQTLQHFGVADYVRATTKVTARLPTAEEARHLKQPVTRPVLQSEALDIDTAGQSVSVNITRFASDRVQIVLETDSADEAPRQTDISLQHN